MHSIVYTKGSDTIYIFLSLQVLHGDIPQQQREITLKSFREGKFPVLVATDVAARGLDIPEVDLVIQCEPPMVSGNVVHTYMFILSLSLSLSLSPSPSLSLPLPLSFHYQIAYYISLI